jgi:hypothetical protein
MRFKSFTYGAYEILIADFRVSPKAAPRTVRTPVSLFNVFTKFQESSNPYPLILAIT